MRIKIIARNYSVSPALERQLDKKLKKLDKFFPPDTEALVRPFSVKNQEGLEITVAFGDLILRAEDATQDMYASIDLVVDKLVRQLRRHKTRLAKRLKEDAFVPAPEEEAEPLPLTDEELGIYRTKKFPVKPQDVEEALLQMQLLGHDFYVFINAATNQVNVIYHRKDGKYGLIEPDYQ